MENPPVAAPANPGKNEGNADDHPTNPAQANPNDTPAPHQPAPNQPAGPTPPVQPAPCQPAPATLLVLQCLFKTHSLFQINLPLR